MDTSIQKIEVTFMSFSAGFPNTSHLFTWSLDIKYMFKCPHLQQTRYTDTPPPTPLLKGWWCVEPTQPEDSCSRRCPGGVNDVLYTACRQLLSPFIQELLRVGEEHHSSHGESEACPEKPKCLSTKVAVWCQ